MLIKAADDKSAWLAALRQQAKAGGVEGRRAQDELERWELGIKGEQDAAYLIDFDFDKPKPHWAVIHDLRLEHGGRVAQLDHLLINRLLEVYVLESKHYNCDLKVNERGEFTAYYGRRAFGVPSPIEQNERHIAVLAEVFDTLNLPERLGLRLRPTFHSYVVLSTNARLTLPRIKGRFANIVKADQIKRAITARIENMPAWEALSKVAKMVGDDTVQDLARQLVARHRPLQGVRSAHAQEQAARNAPVERVVRVAEAPPAAFAPPVAPAPPPAQAGPRCKACEKIAGAVLYGKYGYYFQCADCKTNTAIRFECAPGHSPRLRKDGLKFYRECAQCGTSALYHQNAGGM